MQDRSPQKQERYEAPVFQNTPVKLKVKESFKNQHLSGLFFCFVFFFMQAFYKQISLQIFS